MGRKCPICGRGMFRPKALMEHVKMYHGFYHYLKYEAIQGSRSLSKEERERRKKKREEARRS